MRIHGGIITAKLEESRRFYVDILGFQTKFQTDWFILLHAPGNPENELAFMLPEQPQVRLSGFQAAYEGRGLWLIAEYQHLESEFERLQQMGITFELPMTTEDWGDTHFVIRDPNGILVDCVQERQA